MMKRIGSLFFRVAFGKGADFRTQDGFLSILADIALQCQRTTNNAKTCPVQLPDEFLLSGRIQIRPSFSSQWRARS